MVVRIGVQIPDFQGAGGAENIGQRLAAVARTADDAGFSWIALMDHFFQIGMIGPPEKSTCWRRTRRSGTWRRARPQPG